MLILFGMMFLLLILTVPVGISLGTASAISALVDGAMSGGYIVRTLINAYDSFPVIAVPLFLLAGEIMGHGGISEKLFDLARVFLGKFTGGVPMAVVAACLMFGALSGAGAADTAAIGLIMIPSMVKMGYGKGFSASIVAAAGGLAIIMPPSLTFIMYGVSTSTSVSKLFLAGVLPAIIVAFFLMVYCFFYCRNHGLTNDNLKITEGKKPWPVLKDSIWAILMPVIILGGIYSGYFSPTEAAGVAVAYGLLIGVFVYKTITIKNFYQMILSAAKMTGPILIIVGTASIFGMLLKLEEIPQRVANAITQISENPYIFLLLVNILLLIVGIFMETLSAVLILSPILFPIAVSLGVNPYHFGVIMSVNLAIGLITPPMAVNLFVVSSIADTPIDMLAKSIVKPLLFLIAALMLITYVPWISLALL